MIKDAAAVILLRDPDDLKVFWVKRGSHLSFTPGYHAFPGGKYEVEDRDLRVTAARELFEEVGIKINPDSLSEVPNWVTPDFHKYRFNTRFYIGWLQEEQQPKIDHNELESGEWIRPKDALQKWIDGDCVIVTPIVYALQTLAEGGGGAVERMNAISKFEREHLQKRIEVRYGFYLCPLRTPTIPPATHTNCYLIGGDELVIIDPGSIYEDQQQILDEVIDKFLAQGKKIRETIITHLHHDHTGGVMHLARKYNIPVAAHRLTAETIKNDVRVDRYIADNEIIELNESSTGISWRLRAMLTPGHAKGHLCFYEERTGTIITGDCIVGDGTVFIGPPEGNMIDYLNSLGKLLELPKVTALMPGHGPVIANARAKIEEYITHRYEREQQIINVLKKQPSSIPEIVKVLYKDLPESMRHLAELSVTAHIEKLESGGLVGVFDMGIQRNMKSGDTKYLMKV